MALAGCAKGVSPPQDDLGRYVIRLTPSNTFEPATAWVPEGATVVWVNVAPARPAGFQCEFKSPYCHDVAIVQDDVTKASTYNATTGEALLKPGESWEWTAVKGRYDVFCHMHHDPERMVSTLRVG